MIGLRGTRRRENRAHGMNLLADYGSAVRETDSAREDVDAFDTAAEWEATCRRGLVDWIARNA